MSNASLKDSIKQDMIDSMRAKDKERLGVIRMLQAAIKQKEIDERITLDNVAVIAIVEKMIKQRHESITQYQQGKRDDLAAKEQQEIVTLKKYMPSALSDDELGTLINAAIEQHQATSIKDMGKVMNHLKQQIQGRANMADVSAKVKQQLDL